jgi:hypothetical protein
VKQQQFEATINILTPKPMTDRSDCETALRALCGCETLAPEYFDVVEPIREPFDCNKIGAVIDTVWQWQNGPDTFMWRRRNPKSWGGIYMSKRPEPVHGSVDLKSDAGVLKINEELIRFLKATATGLGADLGLIDATPVKADGTEGCLAVTTWDLRKGLPDLYWGTVFGKPYVELFGAQKLAQAPVARREELAPGIFYLQLTDDLNDVRAEPQLVEQVRTEAKRFLGIDAFKESATAQPCSRIGSFAFP